MTQHLPASMPPPTRRRRPWCLRWWSITIAAIIVLAVIGAIGNVLGVKAGPSVAPTVSATTSTAPAPTIDNSALAATVNAGLLEELGVSSYAETCSIPEYTWPCLISEVRASATVTDAVEVSTTQPVSKEDAEKIARGVMQLSCLKVADLASVIVLDETTSKAAIQWQRGESAAICNQ